MLEIFQRQWISTEDLEFKEIRGVSLYDIFGYNKYNQSERFTNLSYKEAIRKVTHDEFFITHWRVSFMDIPREFIVVSERENTTGI